MSAEGAATAPATDPSAGPVRAGRLVVIVGPSGAGKDSLIRSVMDRLAGDGGAHSRIGLVRRVITRPADAGGEDHEAATIEDFRAMEAMGRFAVSWRAHGLHYGIPASAGLAVAMGRTMLVNGSRGALPSIRAAFGRIETVLVTAAPDILAQRLSARGRESQAEIIARLGRQPADDPAAHDLVIDNSGPLSEATDRFIAFLDR